MVTKMLLFNRLKLGGHVQMFMQINISPGVGLSNRTT